jgi:tetratricopeptide (TPR) repeat protein
LVSWSSRRPRLVIGLVLVVLLGPFITKPLHIDDPLFVWGGQWIQHHPFDFFGARVGWWMTEVPLWMANCNPPLLSYFFAGVASLFGWDEIALHLACLAVSIWGALGIHALAGRWCRRPLLATLLAILAPAFLVSATTLMCDVPMLSLWVWCLVVWDRTLESNRPQGFLLAGLLAGLAILTKYSPITLLPLLPIMALLRTRKPGWWLLGLAVPLVMIAAFEWLTAAMYGSGLLSRAAYYARHYPVAMLGGAKANAFVGLTFAGGSLLPLLFYAPFLWRRSLLLAGGVVILGLWLTVSCAWNYLGLTQHPAPELGTNWFFTLEIALFAAGGLHLLLLTGAEAWRTRDRISIVLALWILAGLLFATVLNHIINARSLLTIIPPAAILLVRRLDVVAAGAQTAGRLLWPLLPAAALALAAAAADFQLAGSSKSVAKEFSESCRPEGHTMWFEAEGGLKYYLERFGGRPLDIERSVLEPGDVLILGPSCNFVTLPLGSIGLLGVLKTAPRSLVNVMGNNGSQAAGFYSFDAGPVPFAIARLPGAQSLALKICCEIKLSSEILNPQEVRAGAVPRSGEAQAQARLSAQEMFGSPNTQAARETQLGEQCDRDGKLEEAVGHYRTALGFDTNDVAALNDLAWILATASKPELHDPEAAVRLARKANALTGSRLPLCLRTLAASYAQTGRYADALSSAQAAAILALLTGQDELIAGNTQPGNLYTVGHVAQ